MHSVHCGCSPQVVEADEVERIATTAATAAVATISSQPQVANAEMTYLEELALRIAARQQK